MLSGCRILPFLVDITEKLNELNIQLQRQNKHLGEMISNVNSFCSKLAFWENNLSQGEVKHFPCLKEKLEKEIICKTYNGENHVQLLAGLRVQFEQRFSDFNKIELLSQFV